MDDLNVGLEMPLKPSKSFGDSSTSSKGRPHLHPHSGHISHPLVGGAFIRQLEDSIEHDVHEKSWTVGLVEHLKTYRQESIAYSWQHDVDSQYFNGIDVMLNLIATFFSIFSAIAITGILSLFDEEGKQVFFYTLSIMAIFVNLLVSVINAWRQVNNYTYKILEHGEKAAKFGDLERSIGDQFSVELKDRYNGKLFLTYISNRFSELDREKPFIRKTTAAEWAEFRKTDPDLQRRFNQVPEEMHMMV